MATDAEAIAASTRSTRRPTATSSSTGPRRCRLRGNQPYEHPDWAFCGGGGARSSEGRPRRLPQLALLDANEKSLRDHLRSLLDVKAQGWDGVMFDRGEAATQYAKDIDGRPVWYKKSTCTSDPYKAGARFSDAYVTCSVSPRGRLQAMMNNGKSPFDPIARMRPDPAQRQLSEGAVVEVPVPLGHLVEVDLVLNETATRPKDMTGNGRSPPTNAASRVRRTRAVRRADHHGEPAWGAEPESLDRLLRVVPRQAVRPRGLGEHRRRGMCGYVRSGRRVQPIRDLPCSSRTSTSGRSRAPSRWPRAVPGTARSTASGCAATARA